MRSLLRFPTREDREISFPGTVASGELSRTPLTTFYLRKSEENQRKVGPWPCAPPPFNLQVLSGNELQGLLSQFQHKHSLLLKVKQQQSKAKQNKTKCHSFLKLANGNGGRRLLQPVSPRRSLPGRSRKCFSLYLCIFDCRVCSHRS